MIAAAVIYCQAAAPTPPPRDELYARAVRERTSGDNMSAIADLQTLLADAPDDVDARLQLGFALRASGRTAEAEAAFREVLREAPDYKDAKVGLAQIQWANGDAAGAKATLGPALMQTPGDPETKAFVDKLTEAAKPAPAASAAPPWRVDESTAYSALSRNLPAWWEEDVALSRKVDADSAVTMSFQTLERFHINETYLEGAYDHGWSGGEWSLAVGGSLDPTFRPRIAVRGDLLLNPWANSPWTLAADVSYARYVAGDVETVTAGADRQVFGDQGKLSARFIGTYDENGHFLPGYSIGGSWRFNAQVDASLSYVDAAETDTGHTVRVRAVGGAANYTVSDRLILHATVTDEMRENSYDRVETALGATAKF